MGFPGMPLAEEGPVPLSIGMARPQPAARGGLGGNECPESFIERDRTDAGWERIRLPGRMVVDVAKAARVVGTATSRDRTRGAHAQDANAAT